MARSFTVEQKKEAVLKVKQLRSQGKTLKEACEETDNIAPSVILSWRNKYFEDEAKQPPQIRRSKPITTLIQIPIPQEGRSTKEGLSVLVIKGTLDDVSSLLERIK